MKDSTDRMRETNLFLSFFLSLSLIVTFSLLLGADSQVISIAVKPGQRVEAEPGTMLLMSSGMSTTAECGSCSRVCTGEGLCKVVFTNKDSADGYLSFLFLICDLLIHSFSL